MNRYYKFSDYLIKTYGEKVYKIPVNLPVTCPNRDGTVGTGGCIFCGDEGAGFETLSSSIPPANQILSNKQYISHKYNAHKFIIYFQNYCNTYMSDELFKNYLNQSVSDDVAGIYISTRPDVISDSKITYMRQFSEDKKIDIVVELGLQSTSDDTLILLNRGHTVQSFIDCVERLHGQGIKVCAHLINDLPWDDDETVINGALLMNRLKVEQVKLHSLYVLKHTELGRMYLAGEVKMLTEEDFMRRTILFLRNLSPDIVVQRLLGRAPADLTVFCSWGRSWRYICDNIEKTMENNNYRQGDYVTYEGKDTE